MQSIFWTSRIGPWSLRSIDKTGSPHLHDCNRLLLMGPWRNSKPQGPKRNIKWKLNHVSLGHPYPSSTSKIFEVKKMQCFKMQFWVIYSSKKYKLKKYTRKDTGLKFSHSHLSSTHPLPTLSWGILSEAFLLLPYFRRKRWHTATHFAFSANIWLVGSRVLEWLAFVLIWFPWWLRR